VTSASSQLRALEAQPRVVIGARSGRQLPILRTKEVRLTGHFLCLSRSANAHILPARGTRRGLLRARRRNSQPGGGASNSAASDENQGNAKTTGVHAARVARPVVGVKGSA
jgi:hypothetical protein